MSELQHSAKGTTWKKKNHKYIGIDANGNYIYDDKSSKSTKKKHKTLLDLAGEDIQKSINEKEARRVQRNNDIANVWQQNITDPLNKINPIYQSKQKKEKQEQMQRRLNTIERMNRREQEFKNKQHLQAQQGTVREPAKVNAYQKQELEKKQAKFVADAKRSAMNTKLNRLEREKADKRNAELLAEANKNRMNSNVRNGRSARDILSERGTTRVMYGTGKDKDGNPVTIRRTASTRPSYDDRGFKTGNATVTDTVVRKSVNHPGGTARDMISRKGTKRVEYKNEGKQRFRVTTDKNYNKARRQVEKWMGDGNSNFFKRKVADTKRSIDRGKRKIKSLFSFNKKKSEKKSQTNEPKIPFNMRMKRDWKKFKKRTF